MGRPGCHFQMHGHHGPASRHCRRPKQWTREMPCSSKGQSPNEADARCMNYSSCNKHKEHHPGSFQKCSWNMRKHHHFKHGHYHHSHHRHHCRNHHHGKDQSWSCRNVEKQSMTRLPADFHECYSNRYQSKACQTDPITEETQEANFSDATETEEVPAST